MVHAVTVDFLHRLEQSCWMTEGEIKIEKQGKTTQWQLATSQASNRVGASSLSSESFMGLCKRGKSFLLGMGTDGSVGIVKPNHDEVSSNRSH